MLHIFVNARYDFVGKRRWFYFASLAAVAVSLMIGIAASLFTAVFFTRLVFDLIWMGSRRVASLSI